MCLTGCARHGLVPRLVAGGRRREALEAARSLARDLGPEDVYVEIQDPRSRGGRRLARELAELAQEAGLRCVATGDPHAHDPARAFLQDAFVAIRHRLTLDGSEDERRGNRQAVLRTPAESAARFAGHPEAVAETLRLAERLEFDLTRDLGYRFPDFVGSHPGETAHEALARVCAYQLGARYRCLQAPRGRERLDEELALIEHHDLAGFFLLHRDILELAREVALRAPGGVGAALAAARAGARVVGGLDRLLPDRPLPRRSGRERLFLGRFLNRDMGSVPDIDLDFPRDVRELLIEEVIARYGPEHAALVAAFPPSASAWPSASWAARWPCPRPTWSA